MPNEKSSKSKNLEAEIIASKNVQRTSPIVRNAVFNVTEALLQKHYGTNYSYRCLQSSYAIREILGSFGIKSYLMEGALCLPWVENQEPWRLGWDGFWDQSHHVWILTEFGEIVDLTASKIVSHPLTLNRNRFDPPKIWWNNGGEMPVFIKYLPKETIYEFVLDTDQDVFDAFRKSLSELTWGEKEETHIRNSNHVILDSLEKLDEMEKKGDGWANGCLRIQYEPLPPWVQQEERRIMLKYLNKTNIPND